MIKKGLEAQFPRSYWVVAEINELNVNSSGHCYLELVQQDETSSFIQAKMAATIWSYSYRMIRPFFETATGQSLSPGLKVLVKVAVQYHEIYGISLNITDIEPSFTVGELEIQRRKTIRQLKDDGIFDMNRELELPILPQRIAIISSKTAAGYQDFMEQLYNNLYGYAFHTTLFAAHVQGRGAEESMLDALNILFEQIDSFDVLVLIRGGGSQTDLLCFDSYRLASHLAQLPIPVLTGIGHDKDESVADLVAYIALKTPTAVADFLVDRMVEQEQQLNELSVQIADLSYGLINEQYTYLNNIKSSISSRLQALFSEEVQYIKYVIVNKLRNTVSARLRAEDHRLVLIGKELEANNPQHILNRGYAIVQYGGKRLTDPDMVAENDELKIMLAKGSLTAKRSVNERE
jgi:exodeoxyribonuclease VII large subunit